MTIAWLAASADPSVRSYRDLLNSLRSSLAQRGLGQRPVYSGSQRFDLDEPFDLYSSCPNHNAWVGRAVSAFESVFKRVVQNALGGAFGQKHGSAIVAPCSRPSQRRPPALLT